MAGTTGELAGAMSAPSRRLAGFLRAGMLDWPGRVSATLFLSGCTYRCPYCHNPRLQRPGTDAVLAWSDVLGHLAAKRSWLDGVVVTGGEPCEDPDLPSLLTALAEAGMPVKLDTNGSRPDVLRTLVAEGLVEYVAMDVKAVPERYDSATGGRGEWSRGVTESIALLTSRAVAHEFRTTVYPGAVALDDLPALAQHLRGGTLLAIQQFKPDAAANPEARSVTPYSPQQLQHAARLCSAYLPTIVRGI